jgi:hypothetical protein
VEPNTDHSFAINAFASNRHKVKPASALSMTAAILGDHFAQYQCNDEPVRRPLPVRFPAKSIPIAEHRPCLHYAPWENPFFLREKPNKLKMFFGFSRQLSQGKMTLHEPPSRSILPRFGPASIRTFAQLSCGPI